jgi:DNA-binding transcriptional LysR family regulator
MICCLSIRSTNGVDPHLLRTFVAVSRCGSFSAAARDLGYTQAAVSQQIAALESDLKVSLLTRRPVRPTEAGARLLEHASPILLRLDAARADVARLAAAPGQRLRAGASPLAGADLAGPLAAVRRSRPRLEISVRTATRETIAAEVAGDELDIGLVDGLAAPSDPLRLGETGPLAAFGLAQEQPAVLLPRTHPLAGRAGLRLGDLTDARWIDAPGVAPPLSDLRHAAGTDGFRAVLGYDGSDLQVLAGLVAAGHGLTLLTRRAARQQPGVTSVPVTSPLLVHRTELLHGTLAPGSAAEALVTALTEAAPAR